MPEFKPKAINARVIIDVGIDRWGLRQLTESELARDAKEIVQRVRSWDEVGHSRIEFDYVCPICGRPWEILDGQPACCRDAIDAYCAAKGLRSEGSDTP